MDNNFPFNKKKLILNLENIFTSNKRRGGGGDGGVWINVDYTKRALPVFNLQAWFHKNLHLPSLHCGPETHPPPAPGQSVPGPSHLQPPGHGWCDSHPQEDCLGVLTSHYLWHHRLAVGQACHYCLAGHLEHPGCLWLELLQHAGVQALLSHLLLWNSDVSILCQCVQ